MMAGKAEIAIATPCRRPFGDYLAGCRSMNDVAILVLIAVVSFQVSLVRLAAIIKCRSHEQQAKTKRNERPSIIARSRGDNQLDRSPCGFCLYHHLSWLWRSHSRNQSPSEGELASEKMLCSEIVRIPSSGPSPRTRYGGACG